MQRNLYQRSRFSLIAATTVLLLAALLSACASGAKNDGITVVNIEQAVQLVDQGATLVDVRSHREWNSGNLAGSKHRPWRSIRDTMGAEPKSTPLLLFCVAGVRAQWAANTLGDLGYQRIYVLKPGGYRELVEAGLAVAQESDAPSAL